MPTVQGKCTIINTTEILTAPGSAYKNIAIKTCEHDTNLIILKVNNEEILVNAEYLHLAIKRSTKYYD